MGVIVVRPGEQVVATRRRVHFELVKDAFVLVQVAEFLLNVVSHVDGLDVFGVASDVPEFDGEVVSGHEVVVFVGKEGG